MPVSSVPPMSIKPRVEKTSDVCQFFDDTQCPSNQCFDCSTDCDDGANG